jgi:hypothetical protein
MSAITLPTNELSSFDLPPVCLITGERRDVTFRPVKFSWYPRWVALLIFVPFGGLLLAAIVAMILTKKAAGELPFSDEGWSRWRLAKLMTAVSVLWVIAALFAGSFFLAAESWTAATLGYGSMVVVPLAIYFTLQRKRTVTPARITNTEITLNIPSEEAAFAVREHLHSGRVVQAAPMAAVAR